MENQKGAEQKYETKQNKRGKRIRKIHYLLKLMLSEDGVGRRMFYM